MPKNAIIPSAGGPGPAPPVPEQSIRFDRTRATNLRGYTPLTSTDSEQWSMSWWQKINGDLAANRVLWEAREDATNFTRFEFLAGLQEWRITAQIAGVNELLQTWRRSFIDVSNWHHCLMQFTKPGNSFIFHINGYNHYNNDIPIFNSAAVGWVWLKAGVEHFIASSALDTNHASVLMAEMHCTGSFNAVTDFGLFNANGVWERKVYVGGHGVQGFYLPFSRTLDLGEDFSGLNHDFAVHTNALGGGGDQLDDWPERNYCTLDPNDARTTGTITEGGLELAGGVAAVTMRPDFGVWYYEFNGTAVVFDTGVSGQFDPVLVAGSYNFGQLPFADVGPMGLEMTLNSNNFPAISTANARAVMANINNFGDSVSPSIITQSDGVNTIYDTEYADILHRCDLVWNKGTSPVRNWFQAHRLRLGTQIPINTAGAEESVNANGVITDLPDPGPGFEVTAGATDLLNHNEFGNGYSVLSLHSRNYSQNIPSGPAVTDNAEEIIASGDTDTTSSDMELNSESDDAASEQICGMRFVNVQIPQGATIISARLQFEADEVRTTTTCDLEIFCEDADNAVTFVDGAANFNVSGRPKTSASTLWTNVPGWTSVQDRGPAQLSPNFASSVQEVVDRGGWVAGNALVALVAHDQASGSYERRTAEMVGSGTPADAHEVMLQVTWRTDEVVPESGVSLFDYTGVGKVADVMHGNPNIPDLIAIKHADAGTDWNVYIGSTVTAGAPETGRYSFNNTGAFLAATGNWNDTPPGGTFVTLGTSSRVNTEGGEYVGFALSNLPGFLKVFRYVGNGLALGPEVYLGFKPRWMCIKRTQVAANWLVMAKATSIIAAQNNQMNIMESMAFLNTDDNFFQNVSIEAYSSGFRLRDTDAVANAAGAEYVGWAFAEAAFQNAKATQ